MAVADSSPARASSVLPPKLAVVSSRNRSQPCTTIYLLVFSHVRSEVPPFGVMYVHVLPFHHSFAYLFFCLCRRSRPNTSHISLAQLVFTDIILSSSQRMQTEDERQTTARPLFCHFFHSILCTISLFTANYVVAVFGSN